jgi:hypothetical protein
MKASIRSLVSVALVLASCQVADAAFIRVESGQTYEATGGFEGPFVGLAGSQIIVSDGFVFALYIDGGRVLINGGAVGGLSAGADVVGRVRGRVEVNGGEFPTGGTFFLYDADLIVSGGTFFVDRVGAGLHTSSGSVIELVGTEFLIDGAPVPGLVPRTTTTVLDRYRSITGQLLDGTTIRLRPIANARDYRQGDLYFAPGAQLRLTLIPEPASAAILGLALISASRARFRSLN